MSCRSPSQDTLIINVLSSGATFTAYLTALVAYLYLKVTDPVYNQDGSYTTVIMTVAFFIGLQIANTSAVPLSSGVATLFVCSAKNEEILKSHYPALHEEIEKVLGCALIERRH